MDDIVVADSEAASVPPLLAQCVLVQLPHQAEVRCPQEDWAGITNSAERRRRQNLLNQRLYRKRRAAKPAKHGAATRGATQAKVDCTHPSKGTGSSPRILATDPGALVTTPATTQQCASNLPRKQAWMARFEAQAHHDYVIGSPRVDDLLTLIQFNVFRALINNMHALRFGEEWLLEDAISPYALGTTRGSSMELVPANLRPTALQCDVSHHPWIDLFPIPSLRDNLLLADDTYDEYDLCNDLVDFHGVSHDRTGLIAWDKPWHASGWEATEGFIAKWPWVVKGCRELAESTNFWRARRGEEPLHFEV
ncbi:hypothetical protein LTR85_009166 [Meristemomyces frigidus]|nr:hypothetical protein LTR85_009166 [Meristemomyces frigidus]